MSLNVFQNEELETHTNSYTNINQPLKTFYPFERFRPGSEETLEKIEEAFSSGKRFVILHAPTGAGKSAFSVSVARKYKAPILTPTKFLQEQYAATPQFDKEYAIKGKGNYVCGLPSQQSLTVDNAICVSNKVAHAARDIVPFQFKETLEGCAKDLKDKCVAEGICEYYGNLKKIGTVPGAIANYDLILRIKKFPEQKWGVEMGDTIVFDEAHQLISKVKEIFGFKFSNIAGSRLIGEEGKRKKDETPVDWLERVLEITQSLFAKETDSKLSAKYDSFIKRAGAVLALEISDERQFHIEDQKEEIEIKPLDIRFLKGKIFYPFKRVLLMSATFPSNFKELFGIKPDECEEIFIPSFFPKENRKVFFPKNICALNKDSVLTAKSENIQLLEKILKYHEHEKGIIHTGNYKFMLQLKKIFKKNPRFIWVDQDADKDEAYAKHVKSNNPTVLVSPAMMEGVDLKDDLARFGVVLKMPYPALDSYTKKMINIFPTWYDTLLATNIAQAYGRQVRTEKDTANFYIIDGQFDRAFNKNRSCYPAYFVEALKTGTVQQLYKFLDRGKTSGDK
jgi:ATP-dependent DNA helicase DinG